MIVVLDTNVWLSGLVGLPGRRSPAAEIIYRWRSREFEVGISQALFEEVEETLREPYFQTRVSFPDRRNAIKDIRAYAIVPISVQPVYGVASHKEDDFVLATAISVGARFIVTRDLQLLKLGQFKDVRIVSPLTFLENLDAEPEDNVSG